jgi:glutathione S-transferase
LLRDWETLLMLTLYHYWDSFCSFKVRLCLEEKALPWTGRHIDLMRFENLAPEYLSVNEHGVVPTLMHDGKTILESSIINEYLDDAFPHVPLIPRDPYERAQMRWWVKHEEEELFIAVRPASLNLLMKQVLGRYTEAQLDELLRHHPKPERIAFLKSVFKAPFDLQAVAKSRAQLSAALLRMEHRLSRGPWLAGASFSLADIAAAPVIDRIQHLGMTDVWDKLEHVTDWVHRLTTRPAYVRALPLQEFRMPKARAA